MTQGAGMTPRTDAIAPSASFVRETRLFDMSYYVPLLELARMLECESALLTERLSLSQQDRHTLEVECRDLRVQNDKLRRALQKSRMTHWTCEDCWYSCPASGECCNEMAGTDCRCGADEHNARIDACLAAIEQGE